jgi:hypothetical protein
MDATSEQVSIFSPAAARVLWIIAVAVAGISFVLNLWIWARTRQDWTTLLAPAGYLAIIGGFSFIRSRVRLYAVLQVIGIVLILAGLIVTRHL